MGVLLLYIIHYPKLVSNYGYEAKCAELLFIYINVHEVYAIETSTYLMVLLEYNCVCAMYHEIDLSLSLS